MHQKAYDNLAEEHEEVSSKLKEREAAVVMERMGQVNWSPDKDQDKNAAAAAAASKASVAPPSPAPIKEVSAMQKQLKSQTKRANDLESQLVAAKMKWGQLDMENDEMSFKM